MFDEYEKVKVSKEVVSRTIDEEIFVLHLKTGVCYVLSSTARFIWELLGENSLSTADIIRLVREKFREDDKDDISSNVRSFIKDLHSNDLVCLSKPAMTDKSQISSLSASTKRTDKNKKMKSPYSIPELMRVKPAVQKRDDHSIKCQTQRSPCVSSGWCL